MGRLHARAATLAWVSLFTTVACGASQHYEVRSVPGDLNLVLQHSRYFGSGGANNRGIAIDSQGNIIMVGGTSEPASATWETNRPRFGPGGERDATVAKFDSDGALLWSLIFGGPDEEYAYVVDITERDEIVVGGRAGDGIPMTSGAFDTSFNGGIGKISGIHLPSDGFVLKLDPDGNVLFATYIGGSADENVRAIEVLRSGMIAVAGGNSASPDLPTDRGVTSNAAEVLKPGLTGPKAAWVALLHPDGARAEFVTYFGPDDAPGQGDETIRSLGEDSRGNIWLGGTTGGRAMSPTPDAFQKDRGDAGNMATAYVAKLSPDGRKLVYFSWLGGDDFDEIETEGTSDAQGNFYVAGSTGSKDFPVTPDAAQTVLLGGGGMGRDGFVARIDDDGSLGFSTFFGGSYPGPEALFGPAVDSEGNVYVSGRVSSPDMLTTVGAYQPIHAGEAGIHDSIFAVFGPTGALRYSTFFGGSRIDLGRHVAVDPNGGAAVIAVETASRDLPMENSQQTSFSGAAFAYFKRAR